MSFDADMSLDAAIEAMISSRRSADTRLSARMICAWVSCFDPFRRQRNGLAQDGVAWRATNDDDEHYVHAMLL
jgi:hypothetical protein